MLIVEHVHNALADPRPVTVDDPMNHWNRRDCQNVVERFDAKEQLDLIFVIVDGVDNQLKVSRLQEQVANLIGFYRFHTMFGCSRHFHLGESSISEFFSGRLVVVADNDRLVGDGTQLIDCCSEGRGCPHLDGTDCLKG